MPPRIAVVYYSMYGHIAKMAESVKAGVEAAGGQCDIFQIPETLSDDVLGKMHAPKKADHPVASAQTLLDYDGILFGIPTRFGNFPGQWKAFWDRTGGIWAKGELHGKFAAVFVSTGTLGGGQEMTAANAMSTFVHHGMNFVPLGYKNASKYLANLDEVHGGSPWGAGVLANGDGSRQPSQLELDCAKLQGQQFWEQLSQYFK
ncbi:NAD(P)H quinone oxidoreductase Pst3p [Diutina catenulata]